MFHRSLKICRLALGRGFRFIRKSSLKLLDKATTASNNGGKQKRITRTDVTGKVVRKSLKFVKKFENVLKLLDNGEKSS